MQMLLSNADHALGGLDIITDLLPDSDYFIFSYLRKEATLSSQIEGTQATFIDAAKAEAGSNPEDSNDYDEILNYIEALNYGLKRLKSDDFPLSLRLIKEIHSKLLSGVRGQHRSPGEFRQSQNWIGGASINTASYVPPEIEDMKNALDQLEHYLHDKNQIPALLKIGLIHSQFETIHPFSDGNGRVGRLLITLLLCHFKLLKKPALYLSEYFKIYRSEYYDRLHAVHEKGDYENWLKFFLEGVWLVAKEATETAKKIKNLKDSDTIHLSILGPKSAKNGIKVLEKLFSRPVVQIKDVGSHTGLSFANANILVKKMESLGILKQIGNRDRGRLFEYTEYIKLFANRSSYKKSVEYD